MARLSLRPGHNAIHTGYPYSVYRDDADDDDLTLFQEYLLVVSSLTDERSRLQRQEVSDELDMIRLYGGIKSEVSSRWEGQDSRQRKALRALPPKPANKLIYSLGVPDEGDLPQIRLYLCYHEEDAILCGGGQKTTNRAQDCPNVRAPFAEATDLTERILACLGDGLCIHDDHLCERLGNNYTPTAHDYEF